MSSAPFKWLIHGRIGIAGSLEAGNISIDALPMPTANLISLDVSSCFLKNNYLWSRIALSPLCIFVWTMIPIDQQRVASMRSQKPSWEKQLMSHIIPVLIHHPHLSIP